jgi:hypothetical protein
MIQGAPIERLPIQEKEERPEVTHLKIYSQKERRKVKLGLKAQSSKHDVCIGFGNFY